MILSVANQKGGTAKMLMRGLGDPRRLAQLQSAAVELAIEPGSFDEARDLNEWAYTSAEAMGDLFGMAEARISASSILEARGQFEENEGQLLASLGYVARGQDLWVTAAALLAELEERGWGKG